MLTRATHIKPKGAQIPACHQDGCDKDRRHCGGWGWGSGSRSGKVCSSSKGETELPWDPAPPLLGMNPREMNINVHARTRTLFLTAKKWQRPVSTSRGTVTASEPEDYSALVHAATWTDLESTQRSQTQHRELRFRLQNVQKADVWTGRGVVVARSWERGEGGATADS